MDAPNQFTLTETIPANPAGIARAAALIRDGRPVAVPTETVYGLAADATSDAAVAHVYAAKGRPAFNPLIVHVAGIVEAAQVALLGPLATTLAARFWPGPLTLVLPLAPGHRIAGLVTAGLATVAVRCPAHPAMRALIDAVGRPLAAPSANRSGGMSPTSAAHVVASLAGRVSLVLDGGSCGHGVESTIVAVDGEALILLRPGPITPAQLAEVAGRSPIAPGDDRVRAPGALASHYAPAKPLRLDAVAAEADEWLVGFGPVAGDDSLSRGGDLVEAAAHLFAALHRADAAPRARIAVAPVPTTGLGLAIADRLRRAAAPRGP